MSEKVKLINQLLVDTVVELELMDTSGKETQRIYKYSSICQGSSFKGSK